MIPVGILIGFIAWFLARYPVGGLYTVEQNERAVKTSFGRAQRIDNKTTLDDPEMRATLTGDETERYKYPQVRVIPAGGPYFKWPWQRVYKVSVATESVNIAFDPETLEANQRGTVLEAVTMDQLNTGLTGQIRYRVSERNLYAYFFGIKGPIVHVMGYFVSVLREKIATFEAPKVALAAPTMATGLSDVSGISINDIRKNMRSLNDAMDHDCKSSVARYGIVLDASLITGIDPPRRRIGAGGHQHGPQRGVVGHQPRAGFGRSEDRPVEARRGDRDPEGASLGRAADGDGQAADRAQG